MSSIIQSCDLLQSNCRIQQPQKLIMRAIKQYDDRCDSEQQMTTSSQQIETTYNGYQNKRSLKIKPLNMFKDIISLKKENSEKKNRVRNLQNLNQQLKVEYERCIDHNEKLQNFLKEVQFTFQPQRKKPQASQILLRAKKTLHDQAKDVKEKINKMFKNSEASSLQEVKVYISVLQQQKQRLQRSVNYMKYVLQTGNANVDFNTIQMKKFEKGSKRVRDTLDKKMKHVMNRHQEYNIEKMIIKGRVKSRHLDIKKNYLKQLEEQIKKKLLESEGLQYEIGLLKHRIKDRKKQNDQYSSLLENIRQKQDSTLRLQKELRQKNKTYEYMLQWSKQLRKQLQGRKTQHGKKKAEYQEQINILTGQYQKYTQIYKAGLFDLQVAKRKGPREQDQPNVTRLTLHGKQITYQQIKYCVRSLSFHLLSIGCQTSKFIQSILQIGDYTAEKQNRNQMKPESLLDNFSMSQNITLQQIISNFEKSIFNPLSKGQIIKIARFAIQDGSGKADVQTTNSLTIVKQVFTNLMQKYIEGRQQLRLCIIGLTKFIQLNGQNLRYNFKLLRGYQQDIDIIAVRQVFKKYGLDPYNNNLFSQLFQFYAWTKRGKVGYSSLQDFDELGILLKGGEQGVLKYFLKY